MNRVVEGIISLTVAVGAAMLATHILATTQWPDGMAGGMYIGTVLCIIPASVHGIEYLLTKARKV